VRVAEYDRYGGPEVLEVRERPAPEVTAGHVVVRVRAAALNPKDVLTRAGKFGWMAGRRFPKRVGYDWSGEVAAVGAGVRGIREGDAVFGMIQAWSAGACGEQVRVRADELAAKPAALGWEEAAALPLAGSTALQALRELGEVRPGDRVLINGASGGVGTLAIQIAKRLGAHVTTLTSAANAELVRGLGADVALDHQAWAPGADRFAVVFDVFGNRTFAALRPILTPRGTFVSTVPKPHVIAARLRTALTRPRARLVVVRSRPADLAWLADAAVAGAVRAVIDGVYPLAEIADAQRRLATRRARGKIVVRVADG
jgi:NADPH:quinone reductase-like Zn-dependent oxidoreductase